MRIELPYGKDTLFTDISDDLYVTIIDMKEKTSRIDIQDQLKQALEHPLDAPPLCNSISPGSTVAIVVDDYTRPSPTKLLLPIVLDELKTLGVDANDITIIIATGTHKPPTMEMMKRLVGDEIVQTYSVISNDNEHGTYLTVGTSSFGHPIEVLKEYVEADVKILIGDIEYHYFAGFGGTRKSVLPGVSSAQTIQNNHSMMFKKTVKKGVIENNPVSMEMTEALGMAGCTLAISVVMNSSHEIIGVWCGNPTSVMKKGMELVDQIYRKELSARPDIIIIASDGHPHDINLYQALKSLYTASQVISKGGVIILVAACSEGMGNDRYVRWMDRYSTADEIQKALEKDFKIGAHKAFYHRKTIEQNPVILISKMNDSYVHDHLGFIPAESLDQAIQTAIDLIKKDSEIIVVPQGSTTHLVLKEKKGFQL